MLTDADKKQMRCIFCDFTGDTLQSLKEHSEECEGHPLMADNRCLREALDCSRVRAQNMEEAAKSNKQVAVARQGIIDKQQTRIAALEAELAERRREIRAQIHAALTDEERVILRMVGEYANSKEPIANLPTTARTAAAALGFVLVRIARLKGGESSDD